MLKKIGTVCQSSGQLRTRMKKLGQFTCLWAVAARRTIETVGLYHGGRGCVLGRDFRLEKLMIVYWREKYMTIDPESLPLPAVQIPPF